MTNPFLILSEGHSCPLAGDSRFPSAGHLWSQAEIDALILARAARRPLLVRGEAGSGKSQIARAAAEELEFGEPLVEVIHPRFEAMELLYRFDALARLADAQANTLDSSNERYVQPGGLWQAYQAAQAGRAPVLLIDEIDKADADIPNALLDVLGNRSFTVPPLNNRQVKVDGGIHPLIVITTNEERELPAAFVRRCVVLNLNPPESEAEFQLWLIRRGKVHTHLAVADAAREHAAKQVWADRLVAMGNGFPQPGLAEYVDLLTAIHELTEGQAGDEREQAQIGWLQKLSAYALLKNPKQDQNRKPVAVTAQPETPNE